MYGKHNSLLELYVLKPVGIYDETCRIKHSSHKNTNWIEYSYTITGNLPACATDKYAYQYNYVYINF